MLPLAVTVTAWDGPGGWPVEGVRLLARYSDGKDLIGGSAVSRAKGVANFTSLKLQDQPGNYTLTVTAPDQPQLSAVNFTVHIRGCLPGEVCADEIKTYCEACPPGYYSFDPSNSSCDACPDYANCSGGALLLPTPGYWHSAPRSPQVHR